MRAAAIGFGVLYAILQIALNYIVQPRYPPDVSTRFIERSTTIPSMWETTEDHGHLSRDNLATWISNPANDRQREGYITPIIAPDARDTVSISRPKIHESVFQRIAVGAHAYAPIGLPPTYDVVPYEAFTEKPEAQEPRDVIGRAALRLAEWHLGLLPLRTSRRLRSLQLRDRLPKMRRKQRLATKRNCPRSGPWCGVGVASIS
jgi:hypothetical protein